jgi:hypothetical protein
MFGAGAGQINCAIRLPDQGQTLEDRALMAEFMPERTSEHFTIIPGL